MIIADEEVALAYLIDPCFQLVNTKGAPLTGGYIEVYLHGTRNKYYCYSDFDGTLHPFQIPIDSLGSNIVLADPANAYDIYIYNKYGSLVMSRYNVYPSRATGGSSSSAPNIDIVSDGTIEVSANYDEETNTKTFKIDVKDGALQYALGSNGSYVYDLHENSYSLPFPDNLDYHGDFINRINLNEYMYVKPGVYMVDAIIRFKQGEGVSNTYGNMLVYTGQENGHETSVPIRDWSGPDQHDESNIVVHFIRHVTTDNDCIYIRVGGPEGWPEGCKWDRAFLQKFSIVKLDGIVANSIDYNAGKGITIDNTYINVDAGIGLGFDENDRLVVTGNYADATDLQVVSTDLYEVSSILSELVGVSGVQSDWNEDNPENLDYIKNKPDLSVYATKDELTDVSGDLTTYIDNSVSTINERIDTVSGDIINTITSVSTLLETEIDNSVSSLEHTIETVSATLEQEIQDIPEQVNADWNAVSGKAEILNKPDLSVYATHEEVSGVAQVVSGDIINELNSVSSVLVNDIQNVSGDVQNITNEITEIHNDINVVSGIVDSVSAKLDEVSAKVDNIPPQEQADWNQTDDTKVDYIKNKPNLDVYATHSELNSVSTVLETEIQTVSAAIPSLEGYATETYVDNSVSSLESEVINTINSVSTVLEGDIQIVSAALQNVSGNVYNEITNIHNDIDYVSGVIDSVSASIPDAQVQSDWNETDNTSKAYIQNKPDLSIYAKESDLQIVSAAVDAVSGQVPNVDITSSDGSIAVSTIINGNSVTYDLAVSGNQPIYFRGYGPDAVITTSTNTNVTADMSDLYKYDGNLNVDAYHHLPLEDGLYAWTMVMNYQVAENVNENIPVKVNVKSNVTNEFNFEQDDVLDVSQNKTISKTLCGLTKGGEDAVLGITLTANQVQHSSDFKAYIKSFTLYKVKGVGNGGSGSVVSGNYEGGWGIIINGNVISVNPDVIATIPTVSSMIETAIDGLEPQVQSNWTETDNTKVDYIKNKPVESTLIPGNGINITASGNDYIISSTVTGGGGGTFTQVNSDWDAVSGVAEILNKPVEYELVGGNNVDITVSGTSVVISASGGGMGQQVQSDWSQTVSTEVDYIKNKPEIEDVEFTNLVAGSGITLTASGETLRIDCNVTGGGGGAQVQADWTETDTTDPSYIQNKPTEKNLIAGANVTITETNNDVTIQTTEIASGLQLAAGTGITLTVSGNYLVIGLA